MIGAQRYEHSTRAQFFYMVYLLNVATLMLHSST
jgi:hypothetical protein